MNLLKEQITEAVVHLSLDSVHWNYATPLEKGKEEETRGKGKGNGGRELP